MGNVVNLANYELGPCMPKTGEVSVKTLKIAVCIDKWFAKRGVTY